MTLPDTPPPVAGGCPRYTAAAALEEATRGNWDRSSFTQTILGESHTFTDADYWAEWIDRGTGYRFGGGICTDVLGDGDELLMLVDRSPAPVVRYSTTLTVKDVPACTLEGTPSRSSGNTVGTDAGAGERSTSISSSSPSPSTSVQMPPPKR